MICAYCGEPCNLIYSDKLQQELLSREVDMYYFSHTEVEFIGPKGNGTTIYWSGCEKVLYKEFMKNLDKILDK